ncbi:MAG TPA: aromatic ring-hydroxylating dioxygenase subunit alpha [Caulobacteraceae bacterium]|nr:aromatic ring-hydroxylating dioxygenase subunit alpha [Caulobacteraceae bacterium]
MALAPRDYRTAEAFDRECRERLAAAWIPVCRSEELAVAGAQKAGMVGATPVLVTRDRSGAAHALSNVCRHRAMTLVEGEAQADAIRCPYHLWTYGLDGALAAAPFMGDVEIAGCDLPRYAVAEWGGWVFVSLAGALPPVAEQLAPLREALDPAHLATLRIGYRMRFDHAWNWKVMVENFGESYHHIGPHAGTLQPPWPGGQTDASVSTHQWIEIRHPVHPEAGALRVFVIFPLFLLAMTAADGSAVWYRLTPTAPERIELDIVGLYPPERASDPEDMERARAQLFAIHQEDMVVCERVQAGLRSPDAILGPLSPLEDGIARFRAWVAGGSP